MRLPVDWLRDRLRAWLLGPPERPETITCLIDGEVRQAAIVGTHGLMLQVVHGRGVRLVSASHCPDQDKFQAAWQAWNTQQLVFEDGTPVRL